MNNLKRLRLGLLLFLLAGCAPKPVPHEQPPPATGAAAVTSRDPEATREAEPGHQKKHD